MAKSKKYEYRIKQDGSNWTTEIIRRITSRKTTVSKSQHGFTSETEAKEWGEKELGFFLQSLKQRNKRHAEQRK